MNTEPLQIRYVIAGPFRAPRLPVWSEADPLTGLEQACEIAGIHPAAARGRNKTHEMCRRRFHVMWLLRQWGRSYPQIGRMLKKDHVTAMNGVKRWAEMQEGK